ncbi:MAG: DUF2318 domain-containing protein [Deferrisomatales bacterium]|nr:DUF2318 domain-containing protein [Deferrisomatales bacterium]
MSHEKPTPEKSAAKKAAVLGARKKSRWPLLTLIAGGAVLLVGGGVVLLGQGGGSTAPVAAVLTTKAQAGEVSHPVGDFDDGRARFFEHRAEDGLTLRYFVLKSSDGVIRSAFDACDSCWRAGRGYRQDGDEMVCQKCGMRFPSVKVMEVKGGCNPAPLRNQVSNGRVVIRVDDLLSGRGYFDFRREG